jgi:hypothetical protein
MKNLLLSFLVLGALGFSSEPAAYPSKTADQVYICLGPYAKVYHQSKECRGLRACTHEIKSVSLSDAVGVYKRRKCKICY